MRRLRGMRYGIVLSLLLAQSPAFAVLKVTSNTARKYWIIRTDTLNHLPRPDRAARLRMVEGGTHYGPFDINTVHQSKTGVQYSVFPQCGGRMKREDPALPDGGRGLIWVEC